MRKYVYNEKDYIIKGKEKSNHCTMKYTYKEGCSPEEKIINIGKKEKNIYKLWAENLCVTY